MACVWPWQKRTWRNFHEKLQYQFMPASPLRLWSPRVLISNFNSTSSWLYELDLALTGCNRFRTRFKAECNALDASAMTLQLTQIQERKNSLHRNVNTWTIVQHLYMPEVSALRDSTNQDASDSTAPIESYDTPLFLPSSLPHSIARACDPKLKKYEGRLNATSVSRSSIHAYAWGRTCTSTRIATLLAKSANTRCQNPWRKSWDKWMPVQQNTGALARHSWTYRRWLGSLRGERGYYLWMMRISVHSETLTTPIWMRGREWRIQSTRSCVWRWQRDISVCLGSGKWWASRRMVTMRGYKRGYKRVSICFLAGGIILAHGSARYSTVHRMVPCTCTSISLGRRTPSCVGRVVKGSGDTGLSSQLVGKSTRTTHRVVSWNNGRSFGVHLQAGISSTSSSIIVLLAMVQRIQITGKYLPSSLAHLLIIIKGASLLRKLKNALPWRTSIIGSCIFEILCSTVIFERIIYSCPSFDWTSVSHSLLLSLFSPALFIGTWLSALAVFEVVSL